MDRRSFLRGAAAVGSTVVAGGVAAGCSSGPPERSGAHGTSTSTSAKSDHGGRPNWNELAASLAGTLLLPGQSGYLAAGQLYNALYAPNPAAIAQCVSSSDVQRCLAFARANDVEVAVRSGGHSYGGYSSGPGLVIDVSRLQGVSMEATIAARLPARGSSRWVRAPS